MKFLLNSFPLLLTQSVTATKLGRLSEAELLARYPLLAAVATVLFSLGVVADVYILLRILNARRSGTTMLVSSKPWGLRNVVFGALALTCTFVLSGSLVWRVVEPLHLAADLENTVLLGGELVVRLLLLFVLARFLRRVNLHWLDAFGLRKMPGGRAFVIGVISYLAILPPLGIVFALYMMLCRWVGIEPTPQPLAELFVASPSNALVALIIVFAVLVAPLFEEVLFRGFAYPALKQRWGAIIAATVSSAAFAAMHFHVPSMAPLFALSIGLGLSYELTGSLLTPITVHALFNATNIAMLLYVRAQT